jgi:SAM-dependent methyltransferase
MPEGPIVGAELGILRGDMSACLLERADLTLYMIDILVREEARRVAAKRAMILEDDSSEMASRFPDKHFDFVFIDADHTLNGVRKDITAWAPKVKPGGYLCGHDYGKGGVTSGVDIAVHQFVERVRRPLELGQNWTWFVQLGVPHCEN